MAEEFAKDRGKTATEWLDERELYTLSKILQFDRSSPLEGFYKYQKYRSDVDSSIDEIDYLREWLEYVPIIEELADSTEERVRSDSFEDVKLKQTLRSILLQYIIYKINILPDNVFPSGLSRAVVAPDFEGRMKKLQSTNDFENSVIQLFKDKSLLDDIIEKSQNPVLRKAYLKYTELIGRSPTR